MIRKSTLALSVVLLFVFVFATVATVQAWNIPKQPNKPWKDFQCCVIDNGPDCSPNLGLWYDGACRCEGFPANPKGCAIDCSTPHCQ